MKDNKIPQIEHSAFIWGIFLLLFEINDGFTFDQLMRDYHPTTCLLIIIELMYQTLGRHFTQFSNIDVDTR